jgi:hypothetical protein
MSLTHDQCSTPLLQLALMSTHSRSMLNTVTTACTNVAGLRRTDSPPVKGYCAGKECHIGSVNDPGECCLLNINCGQSNFICHTEEAMDAQNRLPWQQTMTPCRVNQCTPEECCKGKFVAIALMTFICLFALRKSVANVGWAESSSSLSITTCHAFANKLSRSSVFCLYFLTLLHQTRLSLPR